MAYILRRAILRPPARISAGGRWSAFLLPPITVATPAGIVLLPSNAPTLSNTALSGAVIGVVSVMMSDNLTVFSGTLSLAGGGTTGGPYLGVDAAGDPLLADVAGNRVIANTAGTGGFVTLTGKTLSLNQNMTSANLGPFLMILSATQNGSTLTQTFIGNVTAASNTQIIADAAGDTITVTPQGDPLLSQ